MRANSSYDALLVVSFGGPERPDDVIPFLENVLRGKNVPRERMMEVAEHYRHLGGRSPINDENRALIAAIETELNARGPNLPVYWGNRNWHPLLPDTLRKMADDGVRRALGFMTSAFSSYSGCRQYRENIAQAQELVGPGAPEVHKLRAFFNHPGFIELTVERVREALDSISPDRRQLAFLVYTAHSIPLAMAETCRYQAQLEEASRLVADAFGRTEYRLVFQSRSGPASQPWLEPDVRDFLRELHLRGVRDAVVVPIGFISDHMEVLYDLDTEARQLCEELGVNMIRAGTVGTHPRFAGMIRDLILERIEEQPVRPALGRLGPSHDFCPPDCCPAPFRSARV